MDCTAFMLSRKRREPMEHTEAPNRIKEIAFKIGWFFLYCVLYVTLNAVLIVVEYSWKGVCYVRGK
jgi:hypothetical protein